MPQLELSKETFERLQRLATPLVDTTESLMARILDIYESHAPDLDDSSLPASSTAEPVRDFDGAAPPDLTHTKVLAVQFGKIRLSKGEANWNGVLNEAIRQAKKNSKSDEEFNRLILVNFVSTRKEDEGYRYLGDIGVSVQGQDANAAWKACYHIARQLNRSFEVVFTWRNKEEAKYPGITGRFARETRRFI